MSTARALGPRPEPGATRLPRNFERRRYRELAAGGFPRDDNQITFYNRVRSLLTNRSVVLDLVPAGASGLQCSHHSR